MATTSKLTATNGCYGHSGSGEYSTSDTVHMYVGKSTGTSNYRSRLTFSALSGIPEIGSSRIRITQMLLHIRRNDGGPTEITVGCSSSSKWDAALAATTSTTIDDETGWYEVDITDLADAVVDYTSKWYLHISGKTPRLRLSSTGSSWKPYLSITWECVAATISGDHDSAELGKDTVTFSIAPEVDGETHTLTYSIGDSEGVIAANAGNSIAWTPPASLAAEIPNDDTAVVEIGMSAYDSSGKLLRTEVYYQTVTVPESAVPVISNMGLTKVNALAGYVLAGHTVIDVSPVIDMNSTYGASIAELSMQITGGQSIVWTSLTESNAGVFKGATAQTGAFAEGTVTLTLNITDSRGRMVSQSQNYTVYPYAPPVITDFEVFRYETFYDEDENPDAWIPSDLGNRVAVTLSAEATSIKQGNTQRNLLQYKIVGTNAETGETVEGEETDTPFLDENDANSEEGRRIHFIFRRDIFPGIVGEDETWTYTVTVTDSAGGTAIQYSVVPPGHANLSLSKNKWGVAVGMLASGTKSKPKFEVSSKYDSHFYGSVYDKNGAEIRGAVYVKDSIALDRYVPNGTGTEFTVCNTNTSSDLPGIYIVNVVGRWLDTSGVGEREITIRKYTSDGKNYTYSMNIIPGSSDVMQSQNAFAIIPLYEGERISIELNQDSGASMKIIGFYYIARIGG